jgi:hypothetical protein
MPYIKQKRRDVIDHYLLPLEKYCNHGVTDGEMNYIFSKLIKSYLGSEPSYTDHNTILGVLSAVTLEVYRRYTAPLEDAKIKENGDI